MGSSFGLYGIILYLGNVTSYSDSPPLERVGPFNGAFYYQNRVFFLVVLAGSTGNVATQLAAGSGGYFSSSTHT